MLHSGLRRLGKGQEAMMNGCCMFAGHISTVVAAFTVCACGTHGLTEHGADLTQKCGLAECAIFTHAVSQSRSPRPRCCAPSVHRQRRSPTTCVEHTQVWRMWLEFRSRGSNSHSETEGACSFSPNKAAAPRRGSDRDLSRRVSAPYAASIPIPYLPHEHFSIVVCVCGI